MEKIFDSMWEFLFEIYDYSKNSCYKMNWIDYSDPKKKMIGIADSNKVCKLYLNPIASRYGHGEEETIDSSIVAKMEDFDQRLKFLNSLFFLHRIETKLLKERPLREKYLKYVENCNNNKSTSLCYKSWKENIVSSREIHAIFLPNNPQDFGLIAWLGTDMRPSTFEDLEDTGQAMTKANYPLNIVIPNSFKMRDYLHMSTLKGAPWIEIASLEKLMQLDPNCNLLFRLGSVEHPANQDDLDLFVNLLNLKENNVNPYIVCHHALQIYTIKQNLFDEFKKYVLIKNSIIENISKTQNQEVLNDELDSIFYKYIKGT